MAFLNTFVLLKALTLGYLSLKYELLCKYVKIPYRPA